jgi:hypothetical protein
MMDAQQVFRMLAFNPNLSWLISKDIAVNSSISSTWFTQIRPTKKKAGFLIKTQPVFTAEL